MECTLREDGKLEELIHQLDRYRWNVLGLSEIRKKGRNEIQTLEGHTLYYVDNIILSRSGISYYPIPELKHINGVGFLVNITRRTAVRFNVTSDRIATIILSIPFTILIIQIFASNHPDEEIEVFHN